MKTVMVIVAVLVAAGVVAVIMKPGDGTVEKNDKLSDSVAREEMVDRLPKLLDLGADKCIPCKMMAPILEELKEEYRGVMDVVFIDVWKEPEEGQKYGIESIPTQIFYDSNGKELFRHVGFLSKEDILAKWKDLGFDFQIGAGHEKTD